MIAGQYRQCPKVDSDLSYNLCLTFFNIYYELLTLTFFNIFYELLTLTFFNIFYELLTFIYEINFVFLH
jgi:hypothetical protein